MKTIIITGAAHGVGKEIAKLLEGNRLILIDKDADALKPFAHKIGAEAHVCDLANATDLQNTIRVILSMHQTIDCLINNAGMWISGSMSELQKDGITEMNEIKRIQEVLNTNLFAGIALTSLITPVMQKQGFGQIINVNSQSGVKVEEPYPIYNASKTGSAAFRKAIQEDLANMNIKITDIHPGLIDTDFYKHANNDLPQFVRDLGLTALEVAETVLFVYNLPEHITIPSIELMSMMSLKG